MPLPSRPMFPAMRPFVWLAVLALAACAGVSEAPSCRGEVFPLNPSRMAPFAALAGAAGPAGAVVR